MCFLNIEPDLSFRFSPREIAKFYGDARSAFANGDFMTAVGLCQDMDELRACSLVLSGLTAGGIDCFGKQKNLSSKSILCLSYAHWVEGNGKQAIKLCDELINRNGSSQDAIEKAGALKMLIEKDTINVLISGAIVPVHRGNDDVHLFCEQYDYGQFKTAHFNTQICQEKPKLGQQKHQVNFDSISTFDRPDLVLSLSPQWILPHELHCLDVPKALWCHDTDIFYAKSAANYQQYDLCIMNCQQEHFELSLASQVKCVSNMLLHPLTTEISEKRYTSNNQKKVDIIFTGSALDEFHYEKSRFVYQMSKLPEKFKIKIMPGHLKFDEYFQVLSESKFMPIINRYAGAPSPRWKEALLNSAFVMHPTGTFYEEVCKGCFGYEILNLEKEISRLIENYDRDKNQTKQFNSDYHDTVNRIESMDFSATGNFVRLLKYAAFMTLVWNRGETKGMIRPRPRTIWMTPNIDLGLFNHKNIRVKIENALAQASLNVSRDEKDCNNLFLGFAKLGKSFPFSEQAKIWNHKAEHQIETAIEQYPKSTLLRLNQAIWCIGKRNPDFKKAHENFHYVLKNLRNITLSDVLDFEIGFSHLPWPYEFIFPHFDFAQEIMRVSVVKNGDETDKKFRRILKSACLGYLAIIEKNNGRQKQCLILLRRAAYAHDHYQLRRFWFEELADHVLKEEMRCKKMAQRLYKIFIEAIRLNPIIIINHAFLLVYILKYSRLDDEAQLIFNEWARINRLVIAKNSKLNDQTVISGFGVIRCFPELLSGLPFGHGEEGSNLRKLVVLFEGADKRVNKNCLISRSKLCLSFLNEVRHIKTISVSKKFMAFAMCGSNQKFKILLFVLRCLMIGDWLLLREKIRSWAPR